MEGGSLTEGRSGWVGGSGVGWCGGSGGGGAGGRGGHVWVCGWWGVKQKPIVLDSTFIPTDARFPFILSV